MDIFSVFKWDLFHRHFKLGILCGYIDIAWLYFSHISIYFFIIIATKLYICLIVCLPFCMVPYLSTHWSDLMHSWYK